MIEKFLKAQLEPVTRRRRSFHLWKSLAICWTVAAAAGTGLLVAQPLLGGSLAWMLLLVAVLAMGTALALVIRVAVWQPDYRQIARTIEQQHPELRALLLTAVEQQPDAQTGQFHFLQQRVIDQAIEQSLASAWTTSIPVSRLAVLHLWHAAALTLLVLVLSSGRIPGRGGEFVERAHGMTVTPGNTALEKGQTLVVLAQFDGAAPPEVVLVVEKPGQESRRLPMTRSLGDPLFGAHVPDVTEGFRYAVEHAEGRSSFYQVNVFEHPRLERADATLHFPAYTSQADKQIKDTRRVSAVEGTRLDFDLHLNKPVASARLVPKQGKDAIPLTVETNLAMARLSGHALAQSANYELELIDREGRTNKMPSHFSLEALANRRPEFKWQSPKGDQRVSALEEIGFDAETWDDFGLLGYGLRIAAAGGTNQDLVLGTNAAALQKMPMRHLLALEESGVREDELVSWLLWADDVGPDGQVRRSYSDMFFAEVRPFEEIFREGEGMSGAGAGAGQGTGNQATGLAELQKEIINATWKIIRQETGSKPSASYGTDLEVLGEAQNQALEKLLALKENITDVQALQAIGTGEKAMKDALESIGRAGKNTEPLTQALSFEQVAYQALLKLAGREYNVTRSRSSSGSSGGRGQRQRAQLDQLELKQSEDRYETERQASAQQTPAQQEQLQVLNRLKELARRQEDLNERLKELQNALQEARTEEEREEIRRRLKRLREEQQEILADVDELRQRMSRQDDPANQGNSRQQLEQARSQAQQASEALGRESVSQALSSGTRAQRELQQLRDDYRKQHANQFAEDMRQMRQDARDMARDQNAIAEQLQDLNQTRRQSLAGGESPTNLVQQLSRQQDSLTNLLGQMRAVSEQAENIEPLLSRQLHDAFRKASQSDVDKSLEITRQLLEHKFTEQATQFEKRARDEIQTLARSVEKAAESILGDELESLRMARRELDSLTQQLQRELDQASPSSQTGQGDGSDPNATDRPGESQDQARNAGQPGAADGRPTNGVASARSGQPGTDTNGLAQAGSESRENNAGGQSQPQNGSGQSARNPGQSREPGSAQDPSSASGQQGARAQANQRGNGQQPGQSEGNGSGQGQGAENGNQPGNQGASSQAQNGGRDQGRGQESGRSAQSASQSRQGGMPQGRGDRRGGNFFDSGFNSGPNGFEGPLTGSEFVNWSDRLRNVEEVLDQPELRTEVADVRERARAMRGEFKRHGKEPQWDLVQSQVLTPLRAVQTRVAEEIARRQSDDALVPIDRDPVPTRYSDLVRRYYERLGKE